MLKTFFCGWQASTIAPLFFKCLAAIINFHLKASNRVSHQSIQCQRKENIQSETVREEPERTEEPTTNILARKLMRIN